MAVYGVTNREALDPRFKVIGKLRKGGPKQNGRFGKDLEWFRFTSDNDAVVKAFRQAYPEGQPDSFIVRFPYPTLEAVFPTFRELYGQNGQLKEQCDGMNIIQWQEGYNWKRGKMLCQKKCKDVDASPPCPDCPLKLVGRLSVVLVPLVHARIVGTVTVETHSWHDAIHISSELVKYEPLTGKTFRIYREKNRIGAPNKKTNKRMAVDKWLVKIEATPETEMLMIEGAQRSTRLELSGGVPVAQIEAGPEIVWYENNDGDMEPFIRDGNGHFMRCDENGVILTRDELIDESYDNGTADYNEPPDDPAPSTPTETPQETTPTTAPDFSDLPAGDWGAFYPLIWESLGFESVGKTRSAAARIHGTSSPKDVSFGQMYGELADYQASRNS